MDIINTPVDKRAGCFIVVLFTSLMVLGVYLFFHVRVEESVNTTPVPLKQDGLFLDGSVTTPNAANATLPYHVFMPEPKENERLAIMVCIVAGAKGKRLVDSFDWRRFATENRFVIVEPVFAHSEEDFMKRQSYQYPTEWSGEAMQKILNSVAEKGPIDRREVFLYGFSAGAQFAHRYALLYPEECKAVAALAADDYTMPTKSIGTAFFISVGSNDNDKSAGRLDKATAFVSAARKLDIPVGFRIEENMGHAISGPQFQAVLEFLAQWRNREK